MRYRGEAVVFDCGGSVVKKLRPTKTLSLYLEDLRHLSNLAKT